MDLSDCLKLIGVKQLMEGMEQCYNMSGDIIKVLPSQNNAAEDSVLRDGGFFV
jgi:hypothetical protein